MAKSPATWEGRRALTDSSSTSPEAFKQGAHTLMEMNLLSEASVFFDRAGDLEGQRAVLERAVEEGNFFVFKRAMAYLGGEPRPEKVRALAAAAEKKGLLLYAAQAKELLGGQA